MKIHILYEFTEGPWGGGNQFLKVLRDHFVSKGIYVDDISDADIVLFNSNKKSVSSGIGRLCAHACRTDTVIINRVDGPISLRNEGFDLIDRVITQLNQVLFDGCIFQSQWSFKRMQDFGAIGTKEHLIIPNAVSDSSFYPREKRGMNRERKIKIIATSWSPNYHAKGFDVYEYLDTHLDFSRYEMIFVGRSPVQFKNIPICDPVHSDALGEVLRENDIYLTASVDDPCSNALIEGLASGLPAVVRNSGGHPELLGEGGVVFNGTEDVLQAIDTVAGHGDIYTRLLPKFDLADIGDRYIAFFERVISRKKESRTGVATVGMCCMCVWLFLRLKSFALRNFIRRRIEGLKDRLTLRYKDFDREISKKEKVESYESC